MIIEENELFLLLDFSIKKEKEPNISEPNHSQEQV